MDEIDKDDIDNSYINHEQIDDIESINDENNKSKSKISNNSIHNDLE